MGVDFFFNFTKFSSFLYYLEIYFKVWVQGLTKHILSEKPVDKRYLIIHFISKQYQKPA